MDLLLIKRKGIISLLILMFLMKSWIRSESIIPCSMKAAEISAEGISIFKHDTKGKAAIGYQGLTMEVMQNE